jgi:hypothetical protein
MTENLNRTCYAKVKAILCFEKRLLYTTDIINPLSRIVSQHSLLRYDAVHGLESQQTDIKATQIEDFCLMLNCTAPCTNSLSQLH